LPESKQIFLLIGLCLAIVSAGLATLGGPGWVVAAGPPSQDEPPLRVVTKPIEPFVMGQEGQLTGFSIELWEEVARLDSIQYEFVLVETVEQQLEAVTSGQADVAIAAISMTPEREEVVDFSHPYFRSGLQIMTRSEPLGPVGAITAFFLSARFLFATLVLLLVLVVIGHLVWLLERNHNPDFHHNYWPGIWEGLWWSAVTVTTVGYGDKTVKGCLGRLLGMFWMLAGIFILANFTAFVTAEVAVSQLATPINGPEDLPGKRVITVAGTTAADYLRAEGIPFRQVEVIDATYPLLRSGVVEAIVYDAPVLQYHALHEGEGELVLAGDRFTREDYAIAFPTDSPYRERVNRALLEMVRTGTYDTITRHWFGAEAQN
jgi:ABC-type amino acid transport substrate-binding protein